MIRKDINFWTDAGALLKEFMPDLSKAYTSYLIENNLNENEQLLLEVLIERQLSWQLSVARIKLRALKDDKRRDK